jgi:tRNA-guanine family transglycosylase
MGGLVPLLQSGGSVSGFNYLRKDGTKGDRVQWIADALGLIREYFPKAFIHVFGVGAATTAVGVLALGADSVDSLSWRRVANYGAIFLSGRSERFPLFRRGRVLSRPVVREADFPLLSACRCPVCIDSRHVRKRLVALAQSYKSRAIHNAWTVISEVAAFRAAIAGGRAYEFLITRVTSRHRLYKPVMERVTLMRAGAKGTFV